ncbi:MAG: ATP-binding protein [Vicinamibacterales bacterium]
MREAANREERSVEEMRHTACVRLLRPCPDPGLVLTSWRWDTRATTEAETFLLRLIRGAGSRGLAAICPNGSVIRPFLEVFEQRSAFLDTAGLAFVHDANNDDVGIPRNRVRAELLARCSRHSSTRPLSRRWPVPPSLPAPTRICSVPRQVGCLSMLRRRAMQRTSASTP